jgi:hypothetical protein
MSKCKSLGSFDQLYVFKFKLRFMHLMLHIDMKMEKTSLEFRINNPKSLFLRLISNLEHSSHFEQKSYTYKSMFKIFYLIGNMKRWLHLLVNDHHLFNINKIEIKND